MEIILPKEGIELPKQTNYSLFIDEKTLSLSFFLQLFVFAAFGSATHRGLPHSSLHNF